MSSVDQTQILSRAKFNRHPRWAMGIGAALTVLGFVAIVFPFFASLAVEQLIGWILIMSGFLSALNASHRSPKHGLLLSLLGALLASAVGIMLVLYPLSGIVSLTLLIAAFFLAGGLVRITLALRLRRVGAYGPTLFSGILALGLGGLIIAQWPQAAAWLIGLLIGVDLIFAGIASMALATSSRSAA